MKNGWQKRKTHWWFTDFTRARRGTKLHTRALPGYWQVAPYETKELTGVMVTANPTAAAPEIQVPLPVAGRYSVALGLNENYCDRVLVKLKRQRTFDRLAHGDVLLNDTNNLQEVWYRDLDLKRGDALVLKQDAAMARRCAIAYIHLYPAPPAVKVDIPLIATVDGFPGNNGVISFKEMQAEELQFDDTQVSAICHGTDICGTAQYSTNMPRHRFPAEKAIQETFIGADYYPWVVRQLLNYERGGRCLLRDSVAAAHRIGRKLYAYHRMGVTQIYAPMRMFGDPMFDANPRWRCVDFDGTPISRLSIAFPQVRQYFLEHLRETVEFGADGVCLVFCRAWPMILFEEPVAREYKRRTGRPMKKAKPDDAVLLAIRTEIFNDFIREVRRTVTEAARGRKAEVVALPLATPAINRSFGMDCAAWAREGWVQVLCPYPYGKNVTRTDIDVRAWVRELKGIDVTLCPILNRGSAHTGLEMLDRAEIWLKQGVDGLSMWDWDGHLAIPAYRLLAYHLGAAQGRRKLRKIFKGEWPRRQQLLTIDGIRVDRFHPGWNV